MSQLNSKAGIMYFIATLFNKGIAFLTVPIFTRLLSTSDYGVVTTFDSWVNILMIFLSLAMYMAIRTSFVDFPDSTRDFLNTIISFTIVCSLFVFFIVLIFVLYNVEKRYLILFCIIQGFANALLMDYTQYLMMKYKYLSRTFYMIFPNLISVIFSIISLLWIFHDNMYLGRIIPTSIVYMFFSLIILFQVYKNTKPSINKYYLQYALSISLPLILHGAALTILSQSDRTMITLLADASQTGIYSVVYNFGLIGTVITTALEGVWVPWFLTNIKSKQYKKINNRAKDYIHLMSYAIVIVLLIGPDVLKIMASKNYWSGVDVLPPVILSSFMIFAYGLYVNVEHFFKKTINITVNTVAAAIINIVLNFIFIPKYGYIAAGYTTLVSYIISFIFHFFYSRRLIEEVLPIRLFYSSFIEILIMTILYYLFLENLILRWMVLLIYITYVLFKEKKNIIMIKNKLLKGEKL